MRGVDGDSDSDRKEGSLFNGSESEGQGEGAEDNSDGIASSNETAFPGATTHARGRGVSGNVPTSLPRTVPRGQ